MRYRSSLLAAGAAMTVVDRSDTNNRSRPEGAPTALADRDAPRSVLSREIFFDFLEEQEIPYIFGNPGTTELPLVDGCSDHPSVEYVLSLHEDIAVAQAMGYA